MLALKMEMWAFSGKYGKRSKHPSYEKVQGSKDYYFYLGKPSGKYIWMIEFCNFIFKFFLNLVHVYISQGF